MLTSMRMAAATARAISCRMAMLVIISDENTVARTSPRQKMVTQTFSMAVVMASLSVLPLRTSSRMRVTKKMS